MASLGKGEIRLLGRLAINPSIRQVQLAKELQITRSAVNQLWRKLEQVHNLRILSNLDYGAIGFRLIYGWASTGSNLQNLMNFHRWLEKRPERVFLFKSLLTSKMDSRLFFEALIPVGIGATNFLKTLERFRKKPYSLDISYDYASSIANHLNFGYYEDNAWNFESDFRFSASIDAARIYADILPVVHSKRQNPPNYSDIETMAIASRLESNYFCTSTELAEVLKRLNLPQRSDRTLRRRLKQYRSSIAEPYLSLENIGLTQTVIITLEESEEADIYKLLRAQSGTFPKARFLSGNDSIAMILELPERTDWVHISNIIANIVGRESETCTFIAEQVLKRNWLESMIHNIREYDHDRHQR